MRWIPVILILPYVILLLKIYRSLRHLKTINTSSDPSTFVSIIVACRNEQKNLPALLNSLSHQNYPELLYEVLIVNDRSTDGTTEIATSNTGISNLHALNNKGKGKKQALRTGIVAAKADLIITTDADCIMGRNWLRTIAAFYEKNNPDMIICPVILESHRGIFGRFQELEFIGLQGITAGCALSNDATMCNGANLAFKKKVYLSHSDSLHDEINSGDDIFLLHSLKKESAYRILWLESPDACVTAKSSSTFTKFLTQRKRWITKSKFYEDKSTIILGLLTFITNILLISYLIAAIIHPGYIPVFLTVFILKSIPDFLILLNTSVRYGKKKLMSWFLPAQIIYPFYVLSVLVSVPHFR
jgi:cellulose synthase/poly-beta-1,6-N-acetylglucosamine synthase-like glycosyltransferase